MNDTTTSTVVQVRDVTDSDADLFRSEARKGAAEAQSEEAIAKAGRAFGRKAVRQAILSKAGFGGKLSAEEILARLGVH